MLSAVSIRRVEPSSLLLDLQRLCLPGDHPRALHDGVWFLATASVAGERVPVGFGCLAVISTQPWGYLARAGVIPAARGQGIQRRLILARERHARSLGLTHMVTDTSRENLPSSNSLIRAGYRLYNPQYKWGFPDGNYWIKKL